MKNSTKTPLLKIVEKFDKELRDALMSDLKAIRKGRVRLMNHLRSNSGDGLMTA